MPIAFVKTSFFLHHNFVKLSVKTINLNTLYLQCFVISCFPNKRDSSIIRKHCQPCLTACGVLWVVFWNSQEALQASSSSAIVNDGKSWSPMVIQALLNLTNLLFLFFLRSKELTSNMCFTLVKSYFCFLPVNRARF